MLHKAKVPSTIEAHIGRLRFEARLCPLCRRVEFGDFACPGAFDGGFELFQLDRLNQMIGEAGLQTLLNVAIVAKTADGDAGNGG